MRCCRFNEFRHFFADPLGLTGDGTEHDEGVSDHVEHERGDDDGHEPRFADTTAGQETQYARASLFRPSVSQQNRGTMNVEQFTVERSRHDVESETREFALRVTQIEGEYVIVNLIVSYVASVDVVSRHANQFIQFRSFRHALFDALSPRDVFE